MSTKIDQEKAEDRAITWYFFRLGLVRGWWVPFIVSLAAVGIYTLILPLVGEVASFIISAMIGLIVMYVFFDHLI